MRTRYLPAALVSLTLVGAPLVASGNGIRDRPSRVTKAARPRFPVPVAALAAVVATTTTLLLPVAIGGQSPPAVISNDFVTGHQVVVKHYPLGGAYGYVAEVTDGAGFIRTVQLRAMPVGSVHLKDGNQDGVLDLAYIGADGRSYVHYGYRSHGFGWGLVEP